MSFTRYIILAAVAVIIPLAAIAQQVPYGINYQAVARDQTGAELANRQLDIRFGVYSGTAFGNLEYQEIHSDVVTSRYGVFTATIGLGTPVAGDHEAFSDIRWDLGNHFLRVEIKFANDFIEMGTIQFLSVPYALYAGKSLEPGPAGPVGPAGDPATDNQRLSFDGVNLTIDNGETNPTTISTVNMGVLVNNPNDEIQDLRLTNNILSITGNPDSTNIDLSHLVNDKDTSITNEIQDLTFDQENNTLTITGGNSVSLGELVAFKVNLNTTISLPSNTPYTVVFPIIIYNDGDKYNDLNGIFTATEKGNYAFYLTLNLPFQACSASISVDGNEELLIGPTSSGGEYKVYSTMRLLGTEQVSIVVRQTNGFPITTFNISGTFSGFRVF